MPIASKRPQDDQFALLERDGGGVAKDAAESTVHASLSVELEELDEENSQFTLAGRFSFLWSSGGVLERTPTSPTELKLLNADLSAEAQEHTVTLLGELLQLLQAVVNDPSGGYGADPFHPKQPIAKMRIPGESYFYNYRVCPASFVSHPAPPA
jgi:hypothetical protein